MSPTGGSSKPKKKPTKKETDLAKKLTKKTAEPRGCEEQSCKKVGVCSILCDTLHCGTMKSIEPEFEPHCPFVCPSEVKCTGFSCDTVHCGNLKSK